MAIAFDSTDRSIVEVGYKVVKLCRDAIMIYDLEECCVPDTIKCLFIINEGLCYSLILILTCFSASCRGINICLTVLL